MKHVDDNLPWHINQNETYTYSLQTKHRMHQPCFIILKQCNPLERDAFHHCIYQDCHLWKHLLEVENDDDIPDYLLNFFTGWCSLRIIFIRFTFTPVLSQMKYFTRVLHGVCLPKYEIRFI